MPSGLLPTQLTWIMDVCLPADTKFNVQMVSPFRKSGAVDAVLTRRSSIFPTSRNSHSHGTDWNFQFLGKLARDYAVSLVGLLATGSALDS